MPANRQLSILNPALSPAGDSRLIYDLSLDRSFERIITDTKKRSYFLSVLASPLTNVEAVRFRQAVMLDFITHPSLLERLSEAAARFSSLKKENDARRASLATVRRSVSDEIGTENSRLLCQVSASSLKSTFMFTEVFSDALSSFAVNSDGLRSIADFCRNICRSDAFGDIIDIASRLESSSATDVYTVALDFGQDLKLLESKLCSIAMDSSASQQERGVFQKLFSKKKEAAVEKRVSINWYTDPTRDALVGPSFRRLDTLMSKMTRVLFDALSDISRETVFYECAMEYQRFIERRGLPSVLPDIRPADENALTLKDCRDLFLCATMPNSSQIVPNDVDIRAGGMLIRGENNTGKTVYLRSIGCAQLLAQAGLPVLAENAVISVRSGIFSHFAAAEKDFTCDAIPDVAGRFEEEVKELADIIAVIKPNSLVMLNETFQTTAYDEGAEGIYHIINHLRKKGAAIVFVTHLTALFERNLGGMTTATTAPGYKIVTDVSGAIGTL